MRLLTVLVVLLITGTSANADNIRWKPETLKPGDYVSIDQSQGGIIHHVYRGKRGQQYLTESYRGSGPGDRFAFSTYHDQNGNYIRWVRSDGFEWRYEPHDCTRTLGRCQYKQTSSDGRTEFRLRITTATRDGFKFDEYGEDGKRLYGGSIELDERGVSGNGRLTGYQGTQRFRLIRRVYQ